jgi:large subunit ribosomal protein L10Ae
VNETKASIKFQLKKVLCMGVAVANIDMEEGQIRTNIMYAINFLVSLLKKNWQVRAAAASAVDGRWAGLG